jgi:hypothetical protein
LVEGQRASILPREQLLEVLDDFSGRELELLVDERLRIAEQARHLDGFE